MKRNGPWRPHIPSEPDWCAPPLEDDPRLRHGAGAGHPGQRSKSKRRARKRAKR